jgi:Zn-dependent protease
MPGGAITLLRVRGIRIGVDWSWFIILFLIILWLSGFYRDVLGESDEAFAPYALAVASALLFFASILLHELGHAVVAVRNGIPISDITLWMFGGIARLTRDSDSPATEFKVGIAGPLVTLVLVILGGLIGIALAGADDFWEAMRTEGDAQISGSLALIAWLTSINLLVLLFNLVPAFPLDGGRIARAIAWWRTGDRGSATRFAAALGQGFAYLLIGLGIFLLIQGAVLSGIWLAVIGFILNGSARGAVAQSEVTSRIEGISVADVMDREPVAISDQLSVERALDEFFLRYRWPWFPVVDGAGRFRGLLSQGAADAIPEVERGSRTVGEVVDSDGSAALGVSEDAPLESVLGNEALRRLGALMALDGDGRLRGVITADAIGRALRGAATGSGNP